MTAQITGYCDALEVLTQDTLDAFLAMCREDIEFHDPFNHTHNRDHFRLALEHMFKNVKDLRFVVTEKWGSGRSWIIKWTFTGNAKIVGDLQIIGLSEVTFDTDGLVCRHIDHWDASKEFLQKIPGLGAMLRRILRPLSVS